ncbi:HAT dimerization domain protein [Aspergillus oryzae]|nr:HAT dimerization domain protein [Aspergillus oryzae]
MSTVSGPLSDLDRAFYHISKRRKKSPPLEIFEELKTYLDLEGLGTTGQTDILTYWKSRRDDFPILYCMARDFLAVTINGVGVERLFNSARDICHYRRSRRHSDTIEATMLQMCTDRFTIDEEFRNIMDDIDTEDILFTVDERQDDDMENIIYISDIEDVDDLEDDSEDSAILIEQAAEPSLPNSDLTRTQQEVDARTSRSLRHHDRRPRQYKE